MKEQQQHSRVGCGLEIMKESLFLPSSFPVDCEFQEDDLTFEGRELKDVCSLPEDKCSVGITNDTDASESVDESGSQPHLHGRVLGDEQYACVRRTKQGYLERSERHNAPRSPVVQGRWDCPTYPIDESSDRPSLMENDVHRRLLKERSFSTDIHRDEAWERKRDLFHSLDEPGVRRRRVIGRSVSDCTDRGSAEKPSLRSTTRSLTDEDLEELRGCIDLGFGFSDDESGCELKSTFPALELYYAINRQYADIKSRSSPVSPLDRTSSGGSPHSPLSDSLRISSPGDHPSRVKVRLRHWAQAVACSVRQGLSP